METVETEIQVPLEPLEPLELRAPARISNQIVSVVNRFGLDHSKRTVCPLCLGCGMYDPDKRGNRPCKCRLDKLRKIVVSSFPERNRRAGVPVLADLKPIVPAEHKNQTPKIRQKIHDWQKNIIAYAQKNPFASLNLCGSNKIGKSQIAYAVYLNAFENFRTVKCFKMAELLNDYAEAARASFQNQTEYGQSSFVPRLTTGELEVRNSKSTIVIDEFHNVIPCFTRAQMRTTFEILDAIKANGHQLVLLSNFPFDWLRQAMHALRREHGEPVVFIADAIISRISEDAVTEELFF